MTEGIAGTAAAHESPALEDRPPAVRLDAADAVIAGRGIWREVSVSVGEGEFVAVLGPNGAGKSTLLKVILGLLPVASGRVTILGERPGVHNARIGYLPQRHGFDESTRVRGVDLVRLGLDGSRWGVPLPAWLPGGAARRKAAQRVREVIDLVGSTAYAHRPIGELSGGEQQRLLIAAALVRRPRLLLLDEPLDSLDLPNQSAVAALLQRICRSERVAVLLVGHDVNPIQPYLDRVIYFAGGAAAAGRPEEVITGPTLSKLYGVPVEVLRASDGRLVVVGQPEPPHIHSERHA